MDIAFAEKALAWVVLLPLMGAIINGVFGRFAEKKVVLGVAVGSVAGAFLFALLAFMGFLGLEGHGADNRVVSELYHWLTISIPGPMGMGSFEVPIRIAFSMDALSGIMTLVVTGIGLLIHIYSVGYMSEEPSYARFFTYLNLFTASMLILVLGSSLPLMFVGWEGVGVCSYLLIGFWYENEDYAKAGRKAFVANRIGDLGVLAGIFILVATLGTFEFAEINAKVGSLSAPFMLNGVDVGVTIATAASLFLFLGATGKSAQIPLFVWLPDAMAGPTPVSALIHAATMVTSGIYLLCRLSPVFSASPTAMMVIAVIGAFTALLAASIALVQNELKKVLAYSTVSQLGFMFAAVGVGAFTAGFFHVFTHAFFKACLFLGAGSVMHAVGAHGDADMRKLGGLKKILPKTHITFLISTAAIAGFPLSAGFFSKDEILLGATTMAMGTHGDVPYATWTGWLVWGVLAIAATMTSFYMFRLYYMTFAGEYRSAVHDGGEHGQGHDHGHDHDDHDHPYDAHPHESPSTMTVPLMILAAGAAVLGFLGLPHWLEGVPHVWGDFLHGTIVVPEGLEGPHHFDGVVGMAMGAGVGAWLVGWVMAKAFYGTGVPVGLPVNLHQSMPGLHRFLFNKWWVDEFYDFIILKPMRAIALFSAYVDKYLVDVVLTKLAGVVVSIGSWAFTRIQTGVTYAYATTMAAGLLILGWWYTTPHPVVTPEVEAGKVTWAAAHGLGYEYRWDQNRDGKFDEADGEFAKDQRVFERSYTRDQLTGLVVRIDRNGPGGVRELELSEGLPLILGAAELGSGWAAGSAESDSPMGIRLANDGGELKAVVRPNDASVSLAQGDEHSLSIGETFYVGPRTDSGGSSITILGVVTETVQVRNAFTNVASDTATAIVETAAAPPMKQDDKNEDTTAALAPSIGATVRALAQKADVAAQSAQAVQEGAL